MSQIFQWAIGNFRCHRKTKARDMYLLRLTKQNIINGITLTIEASFLKVLEARISRWWCQQSGFLPSPHSVVFRWLPLRCVLTWSFLSVNTCPCLYLFFQHGHQLYQIRALPNDLIVT